MMDFMQYTQWLIPVLSVGAAFGGVRVGLNGTRERVKEQAADIKRLEKLDAQHGERLARIETKIDILLENK